MRYIFESRILLLLAYNACLIWSGGGDSGEGGDDGRVAAVPRVRAAGGGASAGVGGRTIRICQVGRGSAPPGVDHIEGTVKAVVGPVYDRFHVVTLDLLKFIGRK